MASDKPTTTDSAVARSGLVQETFDAPVLPAAATEPEDPSTPDGTPVFVFTASEKPTRFVWAMDTTHVFTEVSDELAASVGSTPADIVGLNWDEVSASRGFQNGAAIGALLEKGDTWSGRTVMWPVEGAGLRVPVDLAGLPSYDRNRAFSGFNGFGLIRTADAVADPALEKANEADPTNASSILGANAAGIAGAGAAALGVAGALAGATATDNAASDETVVDLRSRQAKANRDLSSDEREAFDEIGDRLSTQNDGPSDPADGSAADKTVEEATIPPVNDADGTANANAKAKAKAKAKSKDGNEDGGGTNGSAPKAPLIPSAFVASSRAASADQEDAKATANPSSDRELASAPPAADGIEAASATDGDATDEAETSTATVVAKEGTLAAGVAATAAASAATAASGVVASATSSKTDEGAADPSRNTNLPAPSADKASSAQDVDTSILARLPIPVLVYRGDELLFGNEEFFSTTGYGDLQSLSNAGGVEALFGASSAQEESIQARIFHRSGDRLPLRAHIQRVPWDSEKAMLLTLRDDEGGDDEDPSPNRGEPNGDGSSGNGPVETDPTSSTPSHGEPTTAPTGNHETLNTGATASAEVDESKDRMTDKDSRAKAGDAARSDRPVLSLVGATGAALVAGTALKRQDDDVATDLPDEKRPGADLVSLASVQKPPSLKQGKSVETQTDAFGGLDAEDLRGIVDTATDGVLIVSKEGIIRAMNRSAEALFDTEAETMIGNTLTDLLAPESHRSAMDYLSGMAGTGVASLLNDGREVIGRTSGGGLIPLFMAFGQLQKSDACCAVLRDITQWKRAEEELLTAKAVAEKASLQKTEFLATVSHEIRTPLNAIIGFSDLMVEERFGKIDNDRYRGYLRDISRSGNHVLELINDLLDISKIEAGKMELDFDACDLNTIVSETVALTQPNANKERVIIRTSLSAVVPKVVADQRSLRQIILNLVSNSIKFTKPGGQVIVSTVYDEAGEVTLRVRDTGIGMSELDLARALKPFEQIQDRTSNGGRMSTRTGASSAWGSGGSSGNGTGLGLPLTKAMVEANRASFHIESKLDEGTLVEIHFPSQRVLADR
ncbi:MAG: ATP-binding protein [Pseudomonadota bacterium]